MDFRSKKIVWASCIVGFSLLLVLGLVFVFPAMTIRQDHVEDTVNESATWFTKTYTLQESHLYFIHHVVRSPSGLIPVDGQITCTFNGEVILQSHLMAGEVDCISETWYTPSVAGTLEVKVTLNVAHLWDLYLYKDLLPAEYYLGEISIAFLIVSSLGLIAVLYLIREYRKDRKEEANKPPVSSETKNQFGNL